MQKTEQCTGCGRTVTWDDDDGPLEWTRELESHPAPGRMTYRTAGKAIHQCADGEYVPPGQTAQRRG